MVGDAHKNVREVGRTQFKAMVLYLLSLLQVASIVTPVPGGVGPCTVACLMYNTLQAAKAHREA